MKDDDLSRAGRDDINKLIRIIPLRIARPNDFAAAVEAEDEGFIVEAAKHDGQSAIVENVSRRFVAAAGDVEIGDGAVIENSQRVQSLGRKVDAASASPPSRRKTSAGGG